MSQNVLAQKYLCRYTRQEKKISLEGGCIGPPGCIILCQGTTPDKGTPYQVRKLAYYMIETLGA